MAKTILVAEQAVSPTMPVTEKIAKRKMIVYETHVDPTVVKVAGKKLKNKLILFKIYML